MNADVIVRKLSGLKRTFQFLALLGGEDVAKASVMTDILDSAVSYIQSQPKSGDAFWEDSRINSPTFRDGWQAPGRCTGCVIARAQDGEIDILPWETVSKHRDHYVKWCRLPM